MTADPRKPPQPPKADDVVVADSLAVKGNEVFDDGKGLFEPKSSKVGDSEATDPEDTKVGSPMTNVLLLPFIAIFDLVALFRQYEGWKLRDRRNEGGVNELEPFQVLASAIAKRFAKAKDFELLAAIASVGALVVSKAMNDAEYRKEHPIVKPAKEPKAGNKGARKT